MQHVIENTVTAFAALDFAAENAEIAAIEAQISDMQVAMVRAEARCTVIARATLEARGPSGMDVANALLASAETSDAAKAAPSLESMAEERAALRSGINELRRRIEDARIEVERIKREAAGAVAIAAQPAIDALAADAKMAAERLLLAYAGIFAMNAATGGGRRELDRMERAAAHLSGADNLLSFRANVPVPDEVSGMIGKLAEKGPALRQRIITAAPVPVDRSNSAMFAAAAARAR